MKCIKSRLTTLLRSEEGPTAVEYGVLLALIVVVAIAAITLLGRNARQTFENVTQTIESQPSS